MKGIPKAERRDDGLHPNQKGYIAPLAERAIISFWYQIGFGWTPIGIW
jgi:hypothetical protein